MSKKVEFKDLNLNEIDISRLTRDYIKYPLKPEESPSKNDLEYLFIELNWSRKELAAYFNRGRGFISNLYKRYGIYKTQDQINKKIDKTFKERWGCNPSSTPEVKERMKNTILKTGELPVYGIILAIEKRYKNLGTIKLYKILIGDIKLYKKAYNIK